MGREDIILLFWHWGVRLAQPLSCAAVRVSSTSNPIIGSDDYLGEEEKKEVVYLKGEQRRKAVPKVTAMQTVANLNSHYTVIGAPVVLGR